MPNAESATKLELKAARSDFLDSFAEAEQAIQWLESRLGLRPNNASLGQKIGRLQKTSGEDAGKPFSKALDELLEFNAVRTEIVHRTMSFVALQGTTKALFIANADPDGLPPIARILTLAQFKALTVKVRKLAVVLTGLSDS
jgi:hypothetical protein